MSIFTCYQDRFFKKLGKNRRGQDLKKDTVQMQKVADRMNILAKEFELSPKYQNIRDTNRAEYDTWEFIWEQYTGLDLDPSIMPPTLKDVRKFEIGLGEFNALLGKKQGPLSAALKLPKAQLRSIPELRKFEIALTEEQSFFRDYQTDTGKKVNSFLIDFKSLAKELGGDYIKLTKLEKSLDAELKRRQTLTLPTDLAKSNKIINELQLGFKEFYMSGAGDAHRVMIQALQGKPIGKDMGLGEGKDITPSQQALLRKMVDSFDGIRKRSVPVLIRALNRVADLAKERNLPWVDNELDRIRGHIRQIEFNAMQTDKGPISDSKAFESVDIFHGLNFASDPSMHDGKKISFKHYMPKYTLGILNQIKTIENDVMNRSEKPSDQLRSELDKVDALINRVKGESNLPPDNQYHVDPFYFIKKYAGDVGLFNYKSHVKHTFREVFNTLVKDHLDPATEAGNQGAIDATESMLKSLKGIYDTLDSVDPSTDTAMNDLVRAMTSVTYFRLLGGNVRSATRNATQRLYEFVEYGYRAKRDAKAFYSTHANADENKIMRQRQHKKYGLQWFDGKTIRSKLLDAFKTEDAQLSATSRGALEESFYNDADITVNQNGEIVHSSERFTKKLARGASDIAAKSAIMHRIVEDANRSGTFGVAFALSYQNLQVMPDAWKARKMGKDLSWVEKNSEKGGAVEAWIENQAGRMAYNGTLDLHFEYASWNKARALKGKTGKLLGQFLHYRFSMFDLMHKWMKEGLLSARVGDFSSEEFWKPLRFGILTGLVSMGSAATHTNVQKLFNNDVLETGDVAYTWLTTDRDNPEEVEKLKKVTYGQGGYYFLGPNVNWVLSGFELMDFYNLDGKTVADRDNTRIYHQSLEHLDDRTKFYKATTLVNAQAARTLAYTWPVFIKQGIIPAAQLELGQFESKEQRANRNLAFEWFSRKLPKAAEFLGIQPKTKRRKRPSRPTRGRSNAPVAQVNQEALRSLDLFKELES